METAIFPGRYDQLALVWNFVQESAQEIDLDENALYAVQTAVDEACTNIIEHAYGGEDLGEISCSVIANPTRLTVILRDRGKPFNPDKVPIPNLKVPLTKRKEGGLGLYFIRKLMDEVQFSFSPENGNELTMVKLKKNPS